MTVIHGASILVLCFRGPTWFMLIPFRVCGVIRPVRARPPIMHAFTAAFDGITFVRMRLFRSLKLSIDLSDAMTVMPRAGKHAAVNHHSETDTVSEWGIDVRGRNHRHGARPFDPDWN